MNIQRFVDNNQDEPIFHSNAYAHIAHGSSIGSTDTQSFNDRLNIHRNRQSVRHYGDSLIGRGEMRTASKDQMTLKRFDPLNYHRTSPRGVGVPPRNRSAVPPRPSFREPPTRGYNPYG